MSLTWPMCRHTMPTYPVSVIELEEEAQNSVGDLAAQRLLEVDFVAVDHLAGILCAPRQDDESQVVLDHRDHGVRDVLLFFGQSRVDVLLELLRQLLDDCGRVAGLLAVEFDEWQLSFLRVELELVVNILGVAWGKIRKRSIVSDHVNFLLRTFLPSVQERRERKRILSIFRSAKIKKYSAWRASVLVSLKVRSLVCVHTGCRS